MNARHVISTLGFSLLVAHVAMASTELPAMYDGRSVGMGGTGAAFIDSGYAILANPAALDGIGTFTLMLDASPFRPTAEAPMVTGATAQGPVITQMQSTSSIAPLFLLGAAYRVHERVVLGLGFYPTAGVGAAYKDVGAPGNDIELALSMMELAVPVSVRILDNLSVALSWRATYLTQTMKMPNAAVPGAVDEVSLSGMNFTGLQAGIHYQPLPMLQLGLSYRSKINITATGKMTTNANGTQVSELDARSPFAAPHQIRAGASLSLLGDKLLVAVDVKYLMYSEANKTSKLTIKDTPLGDVTEVTPLNWKDVISGNFGVEYMVTDDLAVRAGYSIQNSATPEETATFTVTTPGLVHSIHFGVGYAVTENIDVDLGGYYVFGGENDVSPDPDGNNIPGDYSLSGYLASLSGGYHF